MLHIKWNLYFELWTIHCMYLFNSQPLQIKSHQVTWLWFLFKFIMQPYWFISIAQFQMCILLLFRYANTSCMSAWFIKTFRISHHFFVPFLVCIGCKIPYSYLNVVERLWEGCESPTDPRSVLPSSSSSRSEGGLVRGGQERVDTFRARIEPDDTDLKQIWSCMLHSLQKCPLYNSNPTNKQTN